MRIIFMLVTGVLGYILLTLVGFKIVFAVLDFFKLDYHRHFVIGFILYGIAKLIQTFSDD